MIETCKIRKQNCLLNFMLKLKPTLFPSNWALTRLDTLVIAPARAWNVKRCAAVPFVGARERAHILKTDLLSKEASHKKILLNISHSFYHEESIPFWLHIITQYLKQKCKKYNFIYIKRCSNCKVWNNETSTPLIKWKYIVYQQVQLIYEGLRPSLRKSI